MNFPTSDLDSKDKNIGDLLAKCESSLQDRNFEDAINGCRAVLNISPENQRAKELMDEAQSKLEAELFTKENLRKAQEFFKLRDFQKTINECQKIQLLDPDNQDVNDLLSKAQQKLEAEPFVQNFINSGRSLFESGLYGEAISQWEKVRSIDPEYPELDRLINNARHMNGSNTATEAEPLFDLEVPPGLTEPGPAESSEGFGFVSEGDRIHQLLEEGDRLFNNEQYQGAIEVWSEIFMLDVNHPDALERIERARTAASEQRLKIKDMVKDAQAAYDRGEVDQAHELFNKVRASDPENSEAAKYLNLIERSDEEPSLDALIASGEDAEKRGQYREAAQYFSQALAVDTENAVLADKIKSLNLLAKRTEQSKNLLGNARAFVAEGKFESARHALTKILESDPSNAEALELMRTVKDSAPSSLAAAGSPVRGGAPALRRGLSISPALLIGLFVLVAAAGGYFFFFTGGNSSEPEINSAPVRPPGSAQPAVSNPGQGKSSTTPVKTTPGADEPQSEKVLRLIREAQFYVREKEFESAITKADEALVLEPGNKDALGVRLQAKKSIEDIEAKEKKLLNDANTYFEYSEFAGAVKLYEKYVTLHPEEKQKIQPLILKCYYNLGVIAIREWRCDIAGDYFRQVLFIDETDQLSKDALAIARRCQKSGTSDIEVRKAVALMEMRR
jgi:tetratricopeptide (TPR) repeat protein